MQQISPFHRLTSDEGSIDVIDLRKVSSLIFKNRHNFGPFNIEPMVKITLENGKIIKKYGISRDRFEYMVDKWEKIKLNPSS